MIDLLMNRRSTRRFLDQPVEKDKIDKILQVGVLSPSSRSLYPWEFIVVEDKQVIAQLSYAKEQGSAFLVQAPLAIVVVADPRKSDVWIEDASIATVLMQLEIETLNLGSCWVQIRNRNRVDGVTSEDYVKEVLHIPEHYKVLSIIGLGYKAEANNPQEVSMVNRLIKEKVHYEKY